MHLCITPAPEEFLWRKRCGAALYPFERAPMNKTASRARSSRSRWSFAPIHLYFFFIVQLGHVPRTYPLQISPRRYAIFFSRLQDFTIAERRRATRNARASLTRFPGHTAPQKSDCTCRVQCARSNAGVRRRACLPADISCLAV